MSKFPANAKVVFKGQFFKVWQWEQKLFDGSTALFEGVSRPDTSIVIAEMDGKIAYTRQMQSSVPEPFLTPPGGVIEEGEDPLAGAKRELLEETGLESDDWELLSTHSVFGKRIDWDFYTYFARNCRRAGEPCPDAGEKIEVLFATPEEYIKLMPLMHFNALAIEEFKKKLKEKK